MNEDRTYIQMIMKKGKVFGKMRLNSYETCLTARSHSSDVKITLVSQD